MEHIQKLTTQTDPVDCERYACACLFHKRYCRPVMPAEIERYAEFVLAKGVFVVRGAKFHCIYNLGNGTLYSIDDACLAALRAGPVGELRAYLEAEGLLTDATNLPTPDAGRESSLNLAFLQTTDLCNLKCIHCYEDAKFDSKDFHTISLADAIYAMDELRDIGVEHIQLTGGEPLCNPDIRGIVRAAADRFKTLEFYSNQILMNEEMILLLKEVGATVALSMYSYDAMNHSFVTLGRRSHGKTEAALELLHKHGMEYRISTILLDGVDLGERGNAPYDLSQKQDVVRLVGRAGASLLDLKTLPRKIIAPRTFATRLNAEDVLFKMGRHNCFGYTLYISSQLDINPCPMEKRLVHGNLRARTPGLLKEILRKDIIGLGPDQIKECKDCEYRYACFECRADSAERPPDAKPWYCAYTPATGEWNEQGIHDMIHRLRSQVRQETLDSGDHS